MKLYITRHGKTQWNVEGRFQGAKNSDLVESGVRDALALHDYLVNEYFDDVYTSPLGRAKETASLVFSGRNDVIIKEDKRLSEMNFGVFEGMLTTDICSQYGTLYDNLWNHPASFTRCPGGGESFLDVHQRIKSFISEMEQRPIDDRVFVVSHGMFFICLLGYLKGLRLEEYPKINRYIIRGCSLTIVDIKQGKYEIEVLGDDHYLVKEDKTTFLIQQKKDEA